MTHKGKPGYTKTIRNHELLNWVIGRMNGLKSQDFPRRIQALVSRHRIQWPMFEDADKLASAVHLMEEVYARSPSAELRTAIDEVSEQALRLVESHEDAAATPAALERYVYHNLHKMSDL